MGSPPPLSMCSYEVGDQKWRLGISVFFLVSISLLRREGESSVTAFSRGNSYFHSPLTSAFVYPLRSSISSILIRARVEFGWLTLSLIGLSITSWDRVFCCSLGVSLIRSIFRLICESRPDVLSNVQQSPPYPYPYPYPCSCPLTSLNL